MVLPDGLADGTIPAQLLVGRHEQVRAQSVLVRVGQLDRAAGENLAVFLGGAGRRGRSVLAEPRSLKGEMCAKPGASGGGHILLPSTAIHPDPMTKLILTTTASVAFAIATRAQGWIDVENFDLIPSINLNSNGQYYTGSYTLQVWELNGTTIPADLVGVNGTIAGYGSGGPGPSHQGRVWTWPLYSSLTTDGFTLEKTFTGLMSDGWFDLGAVDMPNVSPAGSSVVLALVVWNNTTWWGSLESFSGGMAVFVNPTTASPSAPPSELTGWDKNGTGPDLVMALNQQPPPPPWPPSIVMSPASQTVTNGASVTFMATVEVDPNLPWGVLWLFNGGFVTGATSWWGPVQSPDIYAVSLALTNVQPANAGNYQVLAANTVASVTSGIAVLTVVDPPGIASGPASQTVEIGSAAVFEVQATNTLAGRSCQWSFDGTNALAGATNANLALPGVQPAQAGAYTVVVADAYGSRDQRRGHAECGCTRAAPDGAGPARDRRRRQLPPPGG